MAAGFGKIGIGVGVAAGVGGPDGALAVMGELPQVVVEERRDNSSMFGPCLAEFNRHRLGLHHVG